MVPRFVRMKRKKERFSEGSVFRRSPILVITIGAPKMFNTRLQDRCSPGSVSIGFEIPASFKVKYCIRVDYFAWIVSKT
jgi:hypothetical protein